MKINKIYSVYFSPVGNTKKTANFLTKMIANELNLPFEEIDYTLFNSRKVVNSFNKNDLIIWASPVYAGRLPNKLLSYMKDNFIGNDAFVIPVVVYGNRSYDMALAEFYNLLENNNFKIIGAASIIAQHAFSNIIALKRPDINDEEKIKEFALHLVEKIKNSKYITLLFSEKNSDYTYYEPLGIEGEPTVFLKAKPKTDLRKCNNCQTCITCCPMGSINKDDSSDIIGICIKCHACIKGCLENAKYFDDKQFLSHKKMLERDFINRLEPEFYL